MWHEVANPEDVISFFSRTQQREYIATIPLGYADGYLRNMVGIGVLTTSDGKTIYVSFLGVEVHGVFRLAITVLMLYSESRLFPISEYCELKPKIN